MPHPTRTGRKSARDTTTNHETDNRSAENKNMKKSTLWIIIIILALGLFYFAKKADAPNETQDTTPPTAEMTESNEDAKTEDATTVSDSTDFY